MGLNRNQNQYFVKVATGLAPNSTDPPIKIVRARARARDAPAGAAQWCGVLLQQRCTAGYGTASTQADGGRRHKRSTPRAA